ncbi:F-box protein At3g07870-like [Cornus florida]|uniref:F-box protein At3g07870-like n=1 Tax=Cornus florida TaxID=4283 RepID=UPI0028A15E59|nr:F-box protein At3g07870-like [Cornus florida]
MERLRRTRRNTRLGTTLSNLLMKLCSCNVKEEGEENKTSLVDLPSSILVAILSSLPTMTLLNCRRVCKTWHYLIAQDPYFTKICSETRPNVTDIVFWDLHSFYLLDLGEDSKYVRGYHSPMRFRLHFKPHYRHLRLVGSCNGLLCLTNGNTLSITNPILGECVLVPKLERKREVFICIFGFSGATGHYKIVGFGSDVLGGTTLHSEVVVYTLGTDTWRYVGDAPLPELGIEWWGVTLNGAVHWTSGTSSEFIYSFHLDKEHVCRPIPLPPDLRNINIHSLRVGVLRNCLCIYHNSSDYLDIWSMNDYGVAESWTKIRILKNSIQPMMYPPSSVWRNGETFLPATLWRDGEILFSCDWYDSHMFSYNPKERSSTALYLHGLYLKTKRLNCTRGLEFCALPYRPSFSSLKDAASTGGLRMVNIRSKQ